MIEKINLGIHMPDFANSTPLSGGQLDLDLVRSVVTIAETGSFTRAAERLLRTQSTISLQVKRLEAQLGRRLFDRTPRSLRLTLDGERLLPEMRALLELHDAILSRNAEDVIEGTIRLGTPEDFATSHLSGVLARFAQSHPRIALEVTCDLTLNLIERFRAGEFDLVLVKREISGETGGVRVWREPLIWVSGDDRWPEGRHLPLVVSPAPCVYRKRAIESLDRAGKPWRIAYTCGSLAGALAAVKAGLGVAVLPKDMVPHGFRIVDGGALPDLRDTEIALITAPTHSLAVRRLAEHIVDGLNKSRRAAAREGYHA
jgi:DNA-binding transcriptional LysR family regulator